MGNVIGEGLTENINPFTVEDLTVINNTIRLIDSMVPLIQKAESCGTDCEARKRKLEKQRSTLETYKAEFFKKGRPLRILRHYTAGQAEV